MRHTPSTRAKKTRLIVSKRSQVFSHCLFSHSFVCVSGGRGVDVAVEALGRADTFKQCVDAVVDGGRASVFLCSCRLCLIERFKQTTHTTTMQQTTQTVMIGIAPAGAFAPVEITRLVRCVSVFRSFTFVLFSRQIRIIGSYGARARTVKIQHCSFVHVCCRICQPYFALFSAVISMFLAQSLDDIRLQMLVQSRVRILCACFHSVLCFRSSVSRFDAWQDNRTCDY